MTSLTAKTAYTFQRFGRLTSEFVVFLQTSGLKKKVEKKN
jgi:hypothetical protein